MIHHPMQVKQVTLKDRINRATEPPRANPKVWG